MVRLGKPAVYALTRIIHALNPHKRLANRCVCRHRRVHESYLCLESIQFSGFGI